MTNYRGPHGPPFFVPTYLLPLGVAVIQVLGTLGASRGQPEHADLDALAILLLLVGPGALVFRHRYPAIVLGVVLASTITYFMFDYPRGPIFLSLIIAFVTAVMKGRRVAAIGSLVIGYVAFLWLPYLAGLEPAPGWAAILGLAAWLIVLFSVTEIARGRRERFVESARARAEESRRRASEERMRIARELHDVLAHNISLISVQAGVALHLMEEQPEQARTALTAIKQASDEALGELRSVLDVLRQGDESPPRSPTSGLAHLDDLMARTEAAGLRVTKHVAGSPRPVPTGVDVAAFRIVQEALTNVTRHARGANATIRIDYGDRDLTVQIEDRGGAATTSSQGAGKGIRGMRERAAALGGELEAGPRPGGGFRVVARLPLEDGRKEPG